MSEYLDATLGAGIPGVDTNDRPFVITRVFQAPLDLVWRVWTQPNHLMQWFGPPGVTMPVCELDLRPGGVFHYAMQSPEGPAMWGKWIFREVLPLERLVFVASFSDAAGAISRHPMSVDWPLETLSTITFAEHAGKTRGTTVVVRWIPVNATAVERRTFDDAHGSMTHGWTGTLDKLAVYLAQQP